jgi:hypothetical protein
MDLASQMQLLADVKSLVTNLVPSQIMVRSLVSPLFPRLSASVALSQSLALSFICVPAQLTTSVLRTDLYRTFVF